MTEEIMRELEQAAQVILAPPNLITPQQRQSAERIFLNFRRTNSPYQLCRQILDTCTTDYILFETAGLLKTALIKEWSMLSKDDIVPLKQYLLHYVINKPTLAPYVRTRVLQVIAIITKKAGSEGITEERTGLLNEAENLILNGDIARQILGCNIISALMQEYATNEKSSDINLRWEVHLSEKELFEGTDMQRIFKFCINVLSELVKKDIDENMLSLYKHILPILETLLTWEFEYNKIIFKRIRRLKATESIEPLFGHCSQQNLRLRSEWQSLLFEKAVLDLIFSLYWKVRNYPQLAHHARMCLLECASLNGKILNNRSTELEYLLNYLERFRKLITNIEIIDEEAAGIASIILKLLTSFRSNFLSLPITELKPFTQEITQLTCHFIEKAAQEESMRCNDCLYTEALLIIFHAWLDIDCALNPLTAEMSTESVVQIFNLYIRYHLSAPEGARPARSNELNEEEIEDIEEDDKIRFAEQLQSIGNFGRQAASHSIPLLAQLMENRIIKLRDVLNKVISEPATINTLQNDYMVTLYEDLHWLLLIAGHVICLECDDDLIIPNEINTYSSDQIKQGKCNVNMTLQYLSSSLDLQTDIGTPTDSVDHVIRLIADVFRLRAIEKTAMSLNLTSILSPELSTTLTWFLSRWARRYLLPRELKSSEASPTFLQVFGPDSPAAVWFMNFLLEKIECNINVFKGEPALVVETVNLLKSIVTIEQNFSILKCDRLGTIVDLATKRRYDFPMEIRKGLMNAVVKIGDAMNAQKSENEQSFWYQTLQPLQDRCKQITASGNPLSWYHREDIKAEVQDILVSLFGVAEGVAKKVPDQVFEYTYPIIRELPELLSKYQNYQQIVQLILELICEYTSRFICYLPEKKSIMLCEVCAKIIQVYVSTNNNRLTMEKEAEDDSCQNILLLLQLITNIITNNILNFNTDAQKALFDICVTGLKTVIPLLSMDLMKFPTLCTQYFQLVHTLCHTEPDKIFRLPTAEQQQLLLSVQTGLSSFGPDIASLSCDIIHRLAWFIYEDSQDGKPRNQIMAPLINILMDLILSHHFNSDLIPNTSVCMYILICCYQEQYEQLVKHMLSAQTNQEIADRLGNSFKELTTGIQFNTRDSCEFKDKFQDFIVNVQGFLTVK